MQNDKWLLKVADNTEQFFFIPDETIVPASEPVSVPFSCDDLGHVLGLLFELDYGAVLKTVAQYKWEEWGYFETDAAKPKEIYQKLLNTSEVFKLYSTADLFFLSQDFRFRTPTVPYLIQRLKAYMDFCERQQLPYQNDFYDYLKDNHYFGYDVILTFSDGLPDTREYFYNSNKDPKRRDDLDRHYEFYLNEIAAHNNTTPRTYYIKCVNNRLAEIALATFEEIARRKKTIRKCANCGHYFVPENRSDTLYCDRVSPQDPGMNCKTYASQRLWYQKQKSDELATLSRNVLSAKGMLAKRNPDIPAYRRSYDYFRRERMKWKNGYEAGEISAEDYHNWLLSMREQKIIKEALDGND